MNLLGLTGLAAGTILTRHIVSGQKMNQAIQNQNNANLQNELLLVDVVDVDADEEDEAYR